MACQSSAQRRSQRLMPSMYSENVPECATSISCSVTQSRLGESLPHQVLGHIHGHFVRAREAARVRGEIVHRELEHFGHPVQFDLMRRSASARRAASRSCRAEDAGSARRRCPARERRRQQPLRQDHAGAQSADRMTRCPLSPIRAKPLLGATTQQSVAGRLRSLRKYSKTVGLSGRDRREVVECFVDARSRYWRSRRNGRECRD